LCFIKVKLSVKVNLFFVITVLTATSLSYGKAKNSTPHRIKTPDPIEIKFGTVDYVAEWTRHAKFYANPSKGGFPAYG